MKIDKTWIIVISAFITALIIFVFGLANLRTIKTSYDVEAIFFPSISGIVGESNVKDGKFNIYRNRFYIERLELTKINAKGEYKKAVYEVTNVKDTVVEGSEAIMIDTKPLQIPVGWPDNVRFGFHEGNEKFQPSVILINPAIHQTICIMLLKRLATDPYFDTNFNKKEQNEYRQTRIDKVNGKSFHTSLPSCWDDRLPIGGDSQHWQGRVGAVVEQGP